MRKQLKEIGSSERHTFSAEVVRFGWKSGWRGSVRTILVKDVRLGERIVCDHLWFTVGKQFENLALMSGDVITFSARVSRYVKGYKGYRDDVFDKPIETDYRLSFPTHVRKVNADERKQQQLGINL